MSNRKRIIIILSSVGVGTLLSALLVMTRKDIITQKDVTTLIINFLFAAGIIILISIFLARRKK